MVQAGMATSESSSGAPSRRKLVVVGNGMAGMRAVEELLALVPLNLIHQ